MSHKDIARRLDRSLDLREACPEVPQDWLNAKPGVSSLELVDTFGDIVYKADTLSRSSVSSQPQTNMRTWRPRVWGRNPLPSSEPEASVQAAVLDGFAEVVRVNVRLAFEIGDGAADLQDPVVRSRG